jgi:hypothetical protein
MSYFRRSAKIFHGIAFVYAHNNNKAFELRDSAFLNIRPALEASPR